MREPDAYLGPSRSYESGVTGGEIGKRLDMTLRRLRRDTQLLRDLGYPVKGQPGKGEDYSFDPDETVPSLDGNSIAAAVNQLNAASRSPAGVLEASKRHGTRLTALMPRDHQTVSPRGTSWTTDTDGGDHGIPGPRTA
jgi:predicted DNA-binding transcriptional regulator YafY